MDSVSIVVSGDTRRAGASTGACPRETRGRAKAGESPTTPAAAWRKERGKPARNLPTWRTIPNDSVGFWGIWARRVSPSRAPQLPIAPHPGSSCTEGTPRSQTSTSRVSLPLCDGPSPGGRGDYNLDTLSEEGSVQQVPGEPARRGQ